MVEIRKTTLDDILPLREAVIIAGTNRPPEFPGDQEDSTIHFGAFVDDENVCCASFLLNEWSGEPAYQLRGMATRPDLQGRGIGAALLAEAEQYIAGNTKVRALWCNARTPAVAFYRKAGWSIASDEFDVANVGPHQKMCKRISHEHSDR